MSKQAAPIWPRHINGKHKSLGEMTLRERMTAREKCYYEIYLKRHTAVLVFIERMEFRAMERFVNGQDSDFEE